MSVPVTLYSIVSHANSFSGFSIQDSVLSRFLIFCANSHLPGNGRLLGKDSKSFQWLHSLPRKTKSRTMWHQFVAGMFACNLEQFPRVVVNLKVEHVLGASELTIRKIRPTLYHSTLGSVLKLDKFVFTHGFINITLSTVLLICNTSEKYLKTTEVNTSFILSWRKRVNHTARNLMGLSLRD